MAVPGQDPVPLSPVPPLSARPMPWATAERAHGGLSCVGLNYNQGIKHAKAAHCHGSYCSCNSCTVSYPVSHADNVCLGSTDNGFSVSFLIPLLTNLGNLTYASIKLLIFDRSPELTFYFKNIHCSLLNFLFLYSALTLWVMAFDNPLKWEILLNKNHWRTLGYISSVKGHTEL